METLAAAPILEETLDPQDWEQFRAFAHRVLDDTITHLATLRDRPAWQPMPSHVRNSFAEPLPMNPAGAERAYAEFAERIRPYPNGNLHPRFWGWVQGTGTPLAMLADLLASALNPANANHRSRREDFDALVAGVVQTGKEVTVSQVS